MLLIAGALFAAETLTVLDEMLLLALPSWTLKLIVLGEVLGFGELFWYFTERSAVW